MFRPGVFSRILVAVFVCATDSNAELICSDGNSDRNDVYIRSEKVSLGKGEYRILATEDAALTLELTEGDSVKKGKIDFQNTEESLGSAQEMRKAHKVTSVALCRWSSGSLAAVVKLVSESKASFWLVTIERRHLNESKDGCMAAVASPIYRGDSRYRVLAFTGNRQGDTIVVMIGEMSADRPGSIESGCVFFHDCPVGSAKGGVITEFKATN